MAGLAPHDPLKSRTSRTPVAAEFRHRDSRAAAPAHRRRNTVRSGRARTSPSGAPVRRPHVSPTPSDPRLPNRDNRKFWARAVPRPTLNCHGLGAASGCPEHLPARSWDVGQQRGASSASAARWQSVRSWFLVNQFPGPSSLEILPSRTVSRAAERPFELPKAAALSAAFTAIRVHNTSGPGRSTVTRRNLTSHADESALWFR